MLSFPKSGRNLNPLLPPGLRGWPRSRSGSNCGLLCGLLSLSIPSAASVVETLRLDARVHQGIYAAAANPHLEDVLIRYDNLATRIWCMVLDRLPDLSRHVHEHLDLLRAVIDGDEARAADLARIHVSGFEDAVREGSFHRLSPDLPRTEAQPERRASALPALRFCAASGSLAKP